MDIEAFLNRTNRSKASVLRELGLDPKSSLISAYISGRSNPSFEVAAGLLKLGMTPLELFGEEIDGILRNYYQQLFGKLDKPEFREGFNSIQNSDSELNLKVERKVLEMKAKGLI